MQVRTIQTTGREMTTYAWESDSSWYDPAEHYANFVIVAKRHSQPRGRLGTSASRIWSAGTRAFDKSLRPLVKAVKLPRTT